MRCRAVSSLCVRANPRRLMSRLSDAPNGFVERWEPHGRRLTLGLPARLYMPLLLIAILYPARYAEILLCLVFILPFFPLFLFLFGFFSFLYSCEVQCTDWEDRTNRSRQLLSKEKWSRVSLPNGLSFHANFVGLVPCASRIKWLHNYSDAKREAAAALERKDEGRILLFRV